MRPKIIFESRIIKKHERELSLLHDSFKKLGQELSSIKNLLKKWERESSCIRNPAKNSGQKLYWFKNSLKKYERESSRRNDSAKSESKKVREGSNGSKSVGKNDGGGINGWDRRPLRGQHPHFRANRTSFYGACASLRLGRRQKCAVPRSARLHRGEYKGDCRIGRRVG